MQQCCDLLRPFAWALIIKTCNVITLNNTIFLHVASLVAIGGGGGGGGGTGVPPPVVGAWLAFTDELGSFLNFLFWASLLENLLLLPLASAAMNQNKQLNLSKTNWTGVHINCKVSRTLKRRIRNDTQPQSHHKKKTVKNLNRTLCVVESRDHLFLQLFHVLFALFVRNMCL